ncbi:MAG TPA: hypothetical protein VGI39_23355 [Polyangiaceae bacterium]
MPDPKESASVTTPELEQDADRAQAIVDALREGDPSSEEMFEAFWDLDALPVEYVREALTSWVGPLPDPDRLDLATRLRHGMPLPPLRLRPLSVERDADILDSGEVAEAQLRLAGKSWDGHDQSAEERLDGELEGSFAGAIERRVLADRDAPGEPAIYDVLLLGDESGVVFEAGTTKVAALIAGRRVELLDRRRRVAIEMALAEPAASARAKPGEPAQAAAPHLEPVRAQPAPKAKAAEPPAQLSLTLDVAASPEAPAVAEASPAREPQKKVPAKKAPAKKASAKKGPETKAAAKKSAATKAVAKKPEPKKTPAKKAPAKKAAPKKPAATKAVAKKTAAKKTAAKSPKKPAAKRSKR